jgi:hypothetical protein
MTSHPLPPPYYDLPAYDDAVIANRLQQVESRLQKYIKDVLKHNDVAVSEKAQQMVSNILLIYEKRFDDLGGEVRQKMDAFKDWASRLGTGEQTLIEMDKKLAKIHDKVEELDAFHAVIKRHEEREKKIHSDLLRRIKALEEREEKNHDVLIDEGVMRHIEKMVETRIQSMTVSEQKPYTWLQRDELSKISDIFAGKFLLPHTDAYAMTIISTIAPLIVAEIKKEFKDEILAFTDYTYSKAIPNPHQPQNYFMLLNYLNLITNKGNIYAVQFCIDKSNVHQSFSNYQLGKYHIDIKLVKYDETINTTEKNWILANTYTKTHNGIEEELKLGRAQDIVWKDGTRKSVRMGNGILTIISEFEK